ncbi:putative pteridine transporter [Novymonas esmeraldas]|uniref:Pteridine transporter n=1 Tax=Novymonas esmeraldas TaxID=1808958 RepID=A0AAW0ERK6_9TRYP
MSFSSVNDSGDNRHSHDAGEARRKVSASATATACREHSDASRDDSVTVHGVDEAAPGAECAGGGAAVVHAGAATFFGVVPWMRQFPVLGIAIEAFGPVFMFSLGGCYLLMKGITENIVTFSRQPMLMGRFGIDATRYQRLAGISTMGTSIKAAIAVVTDIVALFGYTKRWYMLGSCLVGFAFTLGYGLLPATMSSANIASGFIFLSVFSRANVDLLSEGHYSRLIRRTPAAGPAMVSWIWWMIMLGSIIASVIQGPLSDSGKMQIGVYVGAALHIIPCFIFLFNWYGERPNRVERREDAMRLHEDACAARRARRAQLPRAMTTTTTTGGGAVASASGCPDHRGNGEVHLEPLVGENDGDLVGFSNAVAVCAEGDEDEAEEVEAFAEPDIAVFCGGAVEVNTEVLVRNWKVVVYSVVMTCSVVTMACVTILGTTWDLLYACIVISVVCCVCAFLTLPLVIAKANVFTYLDFVLYVSLPGALDTFYVADEACVPGGPHFSYTFYNTIGAVIQNVAGMVGVALFTYMFSKMRYQVIMCLTVSIRVVASVFDLIMVERWNLAIGIPDHAMYICGDAVVYQVCYQLGYMPIVMLLSRVCPRGSESMVYALMAGFGNLGSSMSGTIGSLLMELAWPIDTTSRPCDYTNARWLIITGHLAAPLLIIPLGFLMLPSARICDDIDVNGRAIHAQVAAEAETRQTPAAVKSQEPYEPSETDE